MKNYAIAIHDTNPGDLTVLTSPPLSEEPSKFGVQKGTSPAITALPSGKWYAAFHATGTDLLWFWQNQPPGANGLRPTVLDLNTSPAVAYGSGDEQVKIAFVSNGTLRFREGPLSATDLSEEQTPYPVSPGSSPAISAELDGVNFLTAWNSGTGLCLQHQSPYMETKWPMMAGTSPSVAVWPESGEAGVLVAYQTGEGYVSAWGAEDGRDWKQPMRSGSSPSVAAHQKGNWLIAFQGPFGELQTVDSDGVVNLGIRIMKDSSPAIAALSDESFLIAYRDASTGTLCTVDPRPAQDPPQPQDTGYLMFDGTSPAIVGLQP